MLRIVILFSSLLVKTIWKTTAFTFLYVYIYSRLLHNIYRPILTCNTWRSIVSTEIPFKTGSSYVFSLCISCNMLVDVLLATSVDYTRTYYFQMSVIINTFWATEKVIKIGIIEREWQKLKLLTKIKSQANYDSIILSICIVNYALKTKMFHSNRKWHHWLWYTGYLS